MRGRTGWPLIVSASLPEAAAYFTVLLLLTVLAVRQARREASRMAELEHRVKNMLSVVGAIIERAREALGRKRSLSSHFEAECNRWQVCRRF